MSSENVFQGSHTTRVKNGIMIRLKRSVKRYRRTYTILEFYSRGFKRHLLALLIFSMLLGLMETFQIVLLYPILNASFNIQEAGIPFIEPLYSIVRSY
ncbi:MAG: hypothetical protein D5R99_04510, partial [Methanocalculus sp. MSAO_Arc1]|uniref:hypothetical protein n=1 Tax=Methanocalculus sp. MSAO_Arc1 TaxID=2293854 RepID=UPI000FF2765F